MTTKLLSDAGTNTTLWAQSSDGDFTFTPATPLGYLTVTINGTPVAIPYYNPV